MSPRPRAHLADLVVPLGLLAALSMVSAMGFLAVFVGWTFLWAPLVAVLAAGAVAWFAARRGLLVGESIALSLVLFLVVGIVVVGGGPTPGAARTFLRALVDGWAELLTSYTPADVTPTVLALPFTLAWLGMLSGGELLRTTRVPGLAALGPLTLLGVSVLFSVDEPLLAVVQGALAVLLTLVLALVQQRQQRTMESDLTTGGSHRWRGRGIVLAAVLVVAAVGLAPLVGPRLPGADANPRFDLRERLEPPFDPLRLPSPLASVKGELEDERAEDVVLRITTDTPVRYWPVAVMGAYDGRVWTVAESADAAAGQYRQVDTFFPAPGTGAVAADVQPVTARIQSVDLGGHWLPTPGWPAELRESDLDVRHNPVTGNVVSPEVVADGDMWTVTGLPRAVVDDDDLAGRDLAADSSAAGAEEADGTATAGGATDLEAVPPVLRSLAGDLVEGLEPGWPQMAAIRDLLVEDGYYDLSPDTPPGHSYFHLGRFLEDEERIVGFEEQYAATGALLARLAGLGARVVVGYDLPEERFDERPVDVRAGDLTAWVEVRVDGLGWVPLDVTPTDESAPDEAEAVRAIEDVAIPNPPPPPPPPPEVERPEQPEVEEETEETEEPEEDEDAAPGPSLPVLLAGVVVGLPLGLLLLFALVVVAWKAVRTRRRRNAPVPAERMTGAWAEFRDRCDERGLRAAATSSPREVALAVAERVPSARATLEGLAATVDRGVFHPDPPDDAGADRAWSLSDHARDELDHGRSTWERLRARLSPAPLRRKD